MREMEDRIKLEDCKHGYLYLLVSRNLKIGFYDEDYKSFIGVRTKFGNQFLDQEYHWDTGAPHGTANPMKDLGPFPFEKAAKGGLIKALKELEKEHAHPEKSWR